MLGLADVHAYYGNIRALRGITLSVESGEIVTLVGSNGAGKTTTLRTILGTVRPRQGNVTFNGQRLDTLTTDRIVRLGIAQSPEGRRIFPRMTVLENLELGAFLQTPRDTHDMLGTMFGRFPVLKARASQRAGTLSGGEQQMLAMARALMGRPKVLLVDEPCLGLSPKMVGVVGDLIRQINAEGISVLVVEQNTAFVFGLAHCAYVIENGEVVLDGEPDRLRRDDRVRSAYLGI